MTEAQDNAVLIANMMAEAKEVARQPEVVHQGDSALPSPMVMTIQDSGMCIIYEEKTGEPLTVLKYMLPELLKAKNPDGSRRFVASTTKVPPRGNLKCFLHVAGPERKHYDELGLPVCRKANLTAPYMVEQHMKKRHPTAWAIIDRERTEKKQNEEREFQRTLMKGGQAQTTAAPMPAIDEAAIVDRVRREVMSTLPRLPPIKYRVKRTKKAVPEPQTA